ncbi:MAG TPA: gfo/Idh/MocA family oxidoreductase [Lachnospiraceae bacterium]|nr:gfo/Idh/MocA family oxidoreductase [Lachnospiraceae bacterium]
MKKKMTVAIAGFGSRGNDIYAHYQLVAPEEMQVTAMADPLEERRKAAQRIYGVAPENCFASAEEMLDAPKLADVCVIATQDKQHVKQAVQAIRKGYHVLCEKPISPDIADCLLLQKTAHEYKKMVAVGHVLRYTPFYSGIRKIIQSGRIGDVVTIQAMENVSYWHQAHSYVRGNWRQSEETSPMIMAKSCHDMDIFCWLLDKKCKKISSYGSLYQFRPEKAPAGAARRCMDGCKAKENCPYDAEKIYVTNAGTGIRDVIRRLEEEPAFDPWPVNVLTPHELTEEAVYRQIQEGPYGRCVYACDNDVVDHQVVNMEFEDHVTVDFTMTAFTSGGGRTIKVCGTMGDICGNLNEDRIVVTEFGKEPEEICLAEGDMSGHSGGDNRMIHDFLSTLEEEADEKELRTGIDVSIQSHIMAAAAEYSRCHGGESIDLEVFAEQAGNCTEK